MLGKLTALWAATKFIFSSKQGAVFIVDISDMGIGSYFSNICYAHLKPGLKALEQTLRQAVGRGTIDEMCASYDIREEAKKLKDMDIKITEEIK